MSDLANLLDRHGAHLQADVIRALDAVIAEAKEEGFWLGRQCGGKRADIDAALAAIRKGEE